MDRPPAPLKQRNLSLAASLIGIVIGMVLLAYASVPLYSLFCQVTGFGGTTQRTAALPTRQLSREVKVSFNTDTEAGLPWEFKPDQHEVTLRLGETKLVAFTAINRGAQPITGTAVYNVTPHLAGQYFMKLQCFCYDRQTLEPGQKMHFPVSFYLDPAMNDDPDLKGLRNITLSYTFFAVKPESGD